MKVLVTGAAGFIGGCAARRWASAGDSVVGLDNLSRSGAAHNLLRMDQFARNAEGAFRFAHGDIRSAEDVYGVFERFGPFDVVLHAAGQVAVTTSVADPVADFRSNALGTLNVLEAVRRHSAQAVFLLASTNKVYGKLEDLGIRELETRYEYASRPNGVDETTPLDFHSPYGCSKGCADQYVRDYARVYGLRTVVVRQSCVYGAPQFGVEDQGWVSWFVAAAVLGKPLTIYGDGKQVRDLLWIEDLLDLYDAIRSRPEAAAGKIYNAGGGIDNTLSLLELVALLRDDHGMAVTPSRADWRPGDQKVFVADSSKARRELGWSPRVGPVEGVAALVRWAGENRDTLMKVVG